MPHLHHSPFGTPRPAFLTLTLILIGFIYLRGWLSLRSYRLKRISSWRAASFLIGLFLIWLAMASPIAALDHELLTVHMLQHLLVMTLAPPLIWLGLPVAAIVCGLPRRFAETLVRLRQSQTMKRFAAAIGRPRFTWLAACGALIGWHIPKLFAFGMQSAPSHWLEHISFLVTGLLFWWPVVPRAAGAVGQDLSLVLYLFSATLPCDILSGFLAFSDRVVYPMYFSSSHLLGFSPLVDQQCAAALMWTGVTIVYLVAGAILTMRILSPRGSSQVLAVQKELQATGIAPRVSPGLDASLSVGQ